MGKYNLDYDKPQTDSSAMLEVARALNNIANEMAERNEIEDKKERKMSY